MNKELRAAARRVQEYCESVTCEACPYYQENAPSGVVCSLNAPRLKRELEDWLETQPQYMAGRPKGSQNRVQRKRDRNIHITMTEKEKEFLMAQAQEAGLSVTDFVQDMMMSLKRRKARQ